VTREKKARKKLPASPSIKNGKQRIRSRRASRRENAKHILTEEDQVSSPGRNQEISRRTIRLTIKSSATGFELISVEHLPMITPPQPGERPEAGRQGGYWFELRDGKNRVLAHRVIDASLLNSVEVHTPDGKIRRVFGELRDSTFEVLLPDVDGARFVALVGDPIATPKAPTSQVEGRSAQSGEIVRFDLSQVRK
jgi:hypothetical protein